MHFLIALSWGLPLVAFIATLAFGADTEEIPQSVQIEGLMYSIKVMGSGLVVLLGILTRILWAVHSSNKESHKQMREASAAESTKHWEFTDGLAHNLNKLLGQHEVAFSLKGCAWEPKNLKEAMKGVMTELASEDPNPFNHIQRKCDKPGYCMKDEMPKGQTGAD